MRISDWSSDVCSSDVQVPRSPAGPYQYENSDALASQRDHPEGAWHHPRRYDAALPPAAPVRWLAELRARTVGEGGRLGDHGKAYSKRGRRMLSDAGVRVRKGLVSDVFLRMLSVRDKIRSEDRRGGKVCVRRVRNWWVAQRIKNK